MPALKDFPYVSRFDDIPIAYAKILDGEDSLIAKASLDNLKNLLPDYRVDLDKNIDLLGIAFNAAVVNLANKNGDVMDTQTALAMANTFSAKPLNREHKRDKIIGHIVNSGFSSYGESNILYGYDISETKDPFNIALGAVVYKIVDKDYAAKIQSSADSESPNYGKLSASWEIGMPDFKIAMGSPLLKEAEIVSDPKYIEELKKHLIVYGGTGKYNGAPIYRLIGQGCIALGCAVTSNPAGNVKGLIDYEKPTAPDNQSVSRATFFGSFFKSLEKNENNSVTINNQSPNMEKLEQILEEIKASLLAGKVKEESIAGLTKDFAAQIKVANEDYLTQISEAKTAKDKAEKENAEIKASVLAQAKELADTKASLEKIQAQANEKAAADLFSARMDEFNNEYDLDNEDRQVLASDIKSLDASAEAFAAFKAKCSKLMAGKSKAKKKVADEQAKAAIDKAVAEKLTEMAKASSKNKLTDLELAEKILEQVQAKASKESVIPNNNQSQSDAPSFKDKWSKLFEDKDAVKVSI